MGSGKGSVELWVCRVKPGRILFEVDGVSVETAQGGAHARRRQAADQDPFRLAHRRLVEDEAMKASDARVMTVDQIDDEVLKLKKEQFNLRFQRATGQLENTSRVRVVRRDIARLKTVARQKRAGDGRGAGSGQPRQADAKPSVAKRADPDRSPGQVQAKSKSKK